MRNFGMFFLSSLQMKPRSPNCSGKLLLLFVSHRITSFFPSESRFIII